MVDMMYTEEGEDFVGVRSVESFRQASMRKSVVQVLPSRSDEVGMKKEETVVPMLNSRSIVLSEEEYMDIQEKEEKVRCPGRILPGERCKDWEKFGKVCFNCPLETSSDPPLSEED